jgi:hypothetical protein
MASARSRGNTPSEDGKGKVLEAFALAFPSLYAQPADTQSTDQQQDTCPEEPAAAGSPTGEAADAYSSKKAAITGKVYLPSLCLHSGAVATCHRAACCCDMPLLHAG